MIRVFYGDDRVAAKKAIDEVLGSGYEVVEGAEIQSGDLPSIFWGGSLLAGKRAILIRDFAENKENFTKLAEYLATPHEVVIFETKIDKRATYYKELKDKIEFREFKLPEQGDFRAVFDIYKIAKRDGKKAVEALGKIKEEQEPYRFLGLLVSQAIKDFTLRQGGKEKRALTALSKLDMDMKSTGIEPWLLIESFLLRLSSL